MKDVAGNGRTVLFVSHNMAAITALCDTAIWIQNGVVEDTGTARKIVDKYLENQIDSAIDATLSLAEKQRSGSGVARFTKLMVSSNETKEGGSSQIVSGSSVQVTVEVTAERELRGANVAVTIYDGNSVRLIDVNTALNGEFLSLASGASATVNFVLESLLLKPGRYIVELWLGLGGTEDIDFVREAGAFEVHEKIADSVHFETYPGIYQCRFSHEII